MTIFDIILVTVAVSASVFYLVRLLIKNLRGGSKGKSCCGGKCS